MSSFTIDTTVRAERVSLLEYSVRSGQPLNVAEGKIEYRTRFLFNGKRISVDEARELIAEYVEQQMYNEWVDAQEAVADESAAVAVIGEDNAELVEIKVNEVAALLSLSPVRVRRMCEEGKLKYGSRGTITVASLKSEIARRRDAEAKAKQAKADRANAKKAQKLGEATDAE